MKVSRALSSDKRTNAVKEHRFSLGEESLGDTTHVIAVTGELDAATSRLLTAMLKRALESGKTHVVIDLAETTFMDSTGLAGLLRDARWLSRPGSALALVASHYAQPRGRFDVTGTGQVLSVCRTREEAIEIVDRPPPAAPPAEPVRDAVRLALYVDGSSPNTAHAIGELDELRRRHLPASTIDIVDIAERPDLAERERLLASPTLVRTSPPPVRRVIGDLSDHEQVLHALDLSSTG
jgi:circadian clock protein KaiB